MKEKIETFLVNTLPAFLSNFIGVLYGFAVPPAKSFSQYGEDLILLNFFKRFGITKGFYVDIGAYHPRFISNTYLLHRSGWRGVCVDLDEDKLKWFRMFRGDSLDTVCAGVSGTSVGSGEATATFYKHKRLLSEIDTLDENTAIKNKRERGWDFSTRQVSRLGINQILEDHAKGHIDFLNIDVEGVDKDIVLSLDLSRFSPTVVLFEDNVNFGGSDQVKDVLGKNGYEKLFVSGGSVAYFLKSVLNTTQSNVPLALNPK